MKLALVTPDVVKGRGQGRVNYELVRGALEGGYAVTLITTQVAPDLAAHPRVRCVHLPVRHLPSRLVKDLWFGLGARRWLRRHVCEHDVIMIDGSVTWADSDVNTVHFVHGAWLRSPYHVSRVSHGPYAWYQGLYSRVHAFLEREAFSRARIVVAISEQVERELRDVGVPSQRLRLIPNGVDGDEFRPAPVDRSRLGLPGLAPLALFVGDIRSRRKNLELVLQALAAVPDLHLAVVGDTNHSPYPTMASELGVRDRAHFLGYREDVPVLMQAADMFVFPSRYEANALVLLEAMAAGLPVIATRTGAAGTMVTADSGVLLEDPSDVIAMREALRKLMDRTVRDRMRVAAREQALHFSWKRMVGAYLALFQELAPKRPSTP